MSDRLAAAYATLGLAPGATPEEIKRAWRRMARATHPDLNPDDPDAARRFKAAEAAHALLTDPARAAAVGAEAPRPRNGPDDDWLDTCAWIAEAHVLHLRRDALPRYAARHRGGPTLAAALAHAAERGLAEGAPDVTPDAFARRWSRHTWRAFELLIDEGLPALGSPVGLFRQNGRVRLVLWPRALWAEGFRDEEALRAVVRRAVDLGVAAAAPLVLDVAPGPATPDDDRRWWIGRLFWPAVWVLVTAFSTFLLGYSWWVANAPERALPEF